MLQTFTITADVPYGFEVESCELVGSRPQTRSDLGLYLLSRLILRPVWKWPEWLAANWIAMDSDGSWCLYEEKPVIEGDVWSDVDGEMSYVRSLGWAFSFTPPPCTDWRKSLRQKPQS